MNRKTRFEAMTAIDESDAVAIARRFMSTSVRVITPPTVGMVMARAIDGALGEKFNLGEVLVTEARVQIDASEGWGMVMGARPDHAIAVAVVDAVLSESHPDAGSIDHQLEQLLAERRQRDLQAWSEVAPTRVHFDNF